jgi:hypothetical protein
VSLSADGNILAIGTSDYSENGNIDVGLLRAYVWDGATWFQRGDDIVGEATFDFSGWSVSLSGDGMVVAIGAFGKNSNCKIDAGYVRVYFWDDNAWIQRGSDIDGEQAGGLEGVSV